MPPKQPKQVDVITHGEASRKNIPTAEQQPVMEESDQAAIQVAYERRNRDLDPQLVWRGKDEQDADDLTVQAPPLFIQEKVHPKVLIDDLMRQTSDFEAERAVAEGEGQQIDLFADFNGLPDDDARTEFYQHDANWSNRMILGDSLQVMASLSEKEGLRGKVQCIYIDPPYGIKFNSNFQWSTTSKDVRDGKTEHITREPEQVKAFRDTWRDGIHSYLSYLRDRFAIARDLLSDSGSVFVQIGDENVHRVRALMDEVFGEENFVNQVNCRTNSGTTRADSLKRSSDYLLWYAKNSENKKFRRLVTERPLDTKTYSQLAFDDQTYRSMTREEKEDPQLISKNAQPFSRMPLYSMSAGNHSPRIAFGREWTIPSNRSWRHSDEGFHRLLRAQRIQVNKSSLSSRYFHNDYPVSEFTETWIDTGPELDKVYVVQTSEKIIQRCILMTTDPGDLVLDPTCGSGTTAYVAEQWGRRWITIDTSRVALALARARIMGARYPYYLLTDSPEGQQKEAELSRTEPIETPTYGDIRQGFVYERVPHITLRAIANNAEIDVIWERFQETLEPLRQQLNGILGENWEEWEIPRDADESWPAEATETHAEWWQQRIARQNEIDASISANADYEYLYDKPYEDKKKVRVAGPFTVESLSPHRVLGIDEDGELIDSLADAKIGMKHGGGATVEGFAQMVLENLRVAGVQQAHKEDKIEFAAINPWPGEYVCAEARYSEGDEESGTLKRAAVFIGPEFGTVSRPDLVVAVREAADADFDALIACAFNYDAHSTDFDKLGRVPVLKARMNADLHMAGDLKNTGKGNLFVIFGEPDIEIIPVSVASEIRSLPKDGFQQDEHTDSDDQPTPEDSTTATQEGHPASAAGGGEPDATGGGEPEMIQVRVRGVDVFHPNTGEIRSDDTDGIACWFIDTDYNEESFFVRHAYFLGANDPYKQLRTTLKAEINQEAWDTLHSDTSRPFPKPPSGRIAVKVINHLGDEVMKVFRV